MKNNKGKRLLLILPPFWTPLIPPVGPASLKSYLEKNGHSVKTIDLNTKEETKTFYFEYFEMLKENIEEEKRGNFYNIGNDILQNHFLLNIFNNNPDKNIKLLKILFYHFFYRELPGSVLKKLDRKVEDYITDLKEYFSYLLSYEQPDIFGVTIFKNNFPLSYLSLKLVKKISPNIKTVLGGGIFTDSHAVNTPNYNKLINLINPLVDKVIIGQGEELLLDFASDCNNSKTSISEQSFNLNNILPDYSDFNLNKYSYIGIVGSYGCLYNCSFCNEKNFWGEYVKKDVNQIVSEMIQLNQRYQKNLFFFTDSLLNPIIDKLSQEILDKKLMYYYDAYFRIDTKSTKFENTIRWRLGGLYRVRIGAESASERMLKIMNKNITPDLIRKSLRSFAQAGIKTTTYWVIGHPGENEYDFQETLRFLEEEKDNIWQAECNIFHYDFLAQNNDLNWEKRRKSLFPKELQKKLLFDEWTLTIAPSREVAFNRMNRFVEHCNKLGIPNPYSSYQNFNADLRWKNLNAYSVPPLFEIIENKENVTDNVKKLIKNHIETNSDIGKGDFKF